MTNPVDRNSKFQGHLIAKVPLHYVCAECGGQIVVKYFSPTMDDLQCASNPKHTGLRKHSEQVQAKAKLRQQDQLLSQAEVQQIAKSSPQVAELIKKRNQQSNKELFGED
jgi:hypothetical protein